VARIVELERQLNISLRTLTSMFIPLARLMCVSFSLCYVDFVTREPVNAGLEVCSHSGRLASDRMCAMIKDVPKNLRFGRRKVSDHRQVSGKSRLGSAYVQM